MRWHSAAGGAVQRGMPRAVVGGMVGGSEERRKAPRLVWLPARPAPPSIGKRKRVPNTRPPLNTRMPSTRTSTKHRRRSSARPPAGTAAKPSGEAVIRKDGKPIVGITFPADWNQKTGDNYISAVSGDGQAYSMLVTLEGVADKQAGIKKVKEGLENYLTGHQVRRAEPRRRAVPWSLPARERARRPASTSCSRLGSSMPGRATRRGGIRRRFQDRGSLQGDGPRHLRDDSPRGGFQQELR